MRLWQTKEIPEDKIYSETAAGWRILTAEIEAIHGKRFDDEPWLQKYFEERYWYKSNAKYSSSVLTAIERKNLENLIAKRSENQNAAVSMGDMDKFQEAPLTEELLKGLSLNDLRLIRNEFWARRGRKFVTPGFRQYFEWRDWYKPLKDQTKVKLGLMEERNVKLIESVETKMREKIATEPITEEMVSGLFVEDLRVLRTKFTPAVVRVFKDGSCKNSVSLRTIVVSAESRFKDDQLTRIPLKKSGICPRS